MKTCLNRSSCTDRTTPLLAMFCFTSFAKAGYLNDELVIVTIIKGLVAT